jgi:hypothetical protein
MNQDEEVVTIDLDDPEFQSPSTYDPEQDIDLRIPPPELDLQGNAIDYVLKLSVGENPNKEKKPYAAMSKGKGTKYLALVVKAQVVAPGQIYDKAFVQYPFGMVTTIDFNGTNSMVDLARKLGSKMPVGLSKLDQAAFVHSLLQSEPTIPGRILWTAYCNSCKNDIAQLNGEARWPEKKDESGEVVGHLPVAECPECSQEVTANPKIKKLFVVQS